MNCWEFMNCPKDIFNNCPAYPAKGLKCWKVTGTKCAQGKYVMATLDEKVLYCRQCNFYKNYAEKY